MRLVCPNCDAEYEVDAAVIPDNGRDVQCSNCGHAWFQLPPEVEAEIAAEEALFTAPPAADEPPEAAPPAPAAAPEPPPEPARSLDDTVLAVLREEAEREAAARRAEAPQPIETQTELGLQPAAAPPAADPVARRIARLKGAEPEPPPPAVPAKPQTRRELLPEIEEINSTLRATSEKRAGEAAVVSDTLAPRRRRSAFRNGFLLIIVVAVLGTAVYAMAPRLSQQIPAAAPALSRYVAGVDAGRIWLDGTIKRLTGTLRGASAE